MQLWRSFDQIAVPDGGTSVALGVFDGLHLGHQDLVGRAVELAVEHESMPVLVTFDPHPVEVVRPGSQPPVLTTVERRAELAAELGMQATFALPFDREMAAWEPEEFVDRVLVDGLHCRAVVVGANFTFGRRAAGTASSLLRMCRERGIDCRVVDLLLLDGERISSTRVRERLATGDVSGAAEILGRPHRVSGMVVHGAGRGGRELGYPTANLDLAEGTAIPTDGVYAGWFTLLDGDDVDGTIEPGRRYATAISVGTNPTFDGTRRTVEAFVLDESADLYDRRAAVEFVGHVRAMEKFSSVAELLEAMDRDVRRTRRMLDPDAR